jgi:hypothetical protein
MELNRLLNSQEVSTRIRFHSFPDISLDKVLSTGHAHPLLHWLPRVISARVKQIGEGGLKLITLVRTASKLKELHETLPEPLTAPLV